MRDQGSSTLSLQRRRKRRLCCNDGPAAPALARPMVLVLISVTAFLCIGGVSTEVPVSSRLLAASQSNSEHSMAYGGVVQKVGNDDDGPIINDDDDDATTFVESRYPNGRESKGSVQTGSWMNLLGNFFRPFPNKSNHVENVGTSKNGVYDGTATFVTETKKTTAVKTSWDWSIFSSRQLKGGDFKWVYPFKGGFLERNGNDEEKARNVNEANESNTDDRPPPPYDAENLQQIDCSQFVGWGDMPDECLQATDSPSSSPTPLFWFGGSGDAVANDTTGDAVPGGGNAVAVGIGDEGNSSSTGIPEKDMATEFPTELSTEVPGTDAPSAASSAKLPPPTQPSNIVSLQLSMGIVRLGDLSTEESNLIVTMCLRAMTNILNAVSPVLVVDYLDTPPVSSNRDNGNRGLLTEQVDGRSRVYWNQDQGDNGKFPTRALDDGMARPAAKLLLQNVHIAESDNMNDWFVVTGDYATFWPNDKPIMSDEILNEVTTGCTKMLSISIYEGDFWNELESLPFGNDLLMDPPPYDIDDAGLADCRPVGEEYDLMPSEVGVGGAAGIDSSNGIESSPADGPPFAGFEPPNWNNTQEATFDTVLGNAASDIVWGTREWLGLGILSMTLLISILLAMVASRLERKRTRDKLWGILTEEGVGEMLQVGWRYHQGAMHPEGDPAASPPQLFLQIFDKAKLGYNDENSMLQGGVERNDVDHFVEQHPIASTATTSTPPTSIAPHPNTKL